MLAMTPCGSHLGLAAGSGSTFGCQATSLHCLRITCRLLLVAQANPNCVLATTPCGGHLGWVAGSGSPFGHPWSDEAMAEWLLAVLTQLKAAKSEKIGASVAIAAAQ